MQMVSLLYCVGGGERKTACTCLVQLKTISNSFCAQMAESTDVHETRELLIYFLYAELWYNPSKPLNHSCPTNLRGHYG